MFLACLFFCILIRPEGGTELFYDKNIIGVYQFFLGIWLAKTQMKKNTAYHRSLKF